MSYFINQSRLRSWILISLIVIISVFLLALYATRNTTLNLLSIKNPRWSPDGIWLLADCAFGSDWQGYARYEVCLTKPDHSDLVRLAPEYAMSRSLQATWSPSGKHVVFVRPEGGLLLIAPQTGAKQSLINISCEEPAWSPDEQQIACVGSGNITVIDVHTGQTTVVTTSGSQFSPHWAQDGKTLLFMKAGSVFPPLYHLYRLDLARHQEDRLEENMSPGYAIAVAPDQEHVVYLNHDLTTIELLNFRTGIRTNMLGMQENCFQDISGPEWSHDGQYLAFNARIRSQNGQIYLLNMQTNEIFQLTHFQETDARLARPSTWSPDNGLLATTAEGSYNPAFSQLVVIPTKTTGLAPVQC